MFFCLPILSHTPSSVIVGFAIRIQGALRALTVNDNNEAAIVSAGGIVELVQLLQSGDADGKREAAGSQDSLRCYLMQFSL